MRLYNIVDIVVMSGVWHFDTWVCRCLVLCLCDHQYASVSYECALMSPVSIEYGILATHCNNV